MSSHGRRISWLSPERTKRVMAEVVRCRGRAWRRRQSSASLSERFHALVPMPARAGRATAYLCFAERCLPAVTDAAARTAQLTRELGHR